MPADPPHHHRADLAVDRRADEKSHLQGCGALLEEIAPAEELMLVPVAGNERAGLRDRRGEILLPEHARNADGEPPEPDDAEADRHRDLITGSPPERQPPARSRLPLVNRIARLAVGRIGHDRAECYANCTASRRSTSVPGRSVASAMAQPSSASAPPKYQRRPRNSAPASSTATAAASKTEAPAAFRTASLRVQSTASPCGRASWSASSRALAMRRRISRRTRAGFSISRPTVRVADTAHATQAAV